MTIRLFTIRRQPPHVRQRGAALVVGLVLLLVLTVLGISGMRTATLELTMANNTEAHQDAFQAAETGIDAAIAARNWTTIAPVVVNLGPATLGEQTTVQARTENTACTPYPDSAFSVSVGVGAYHFDVVSVGTGPRGATSTHNQSFYVAGPAC
jgi:type IV pilus assembly protein PilX